MIKQVLFLLVHLFLLMILKLFIRNRFRMTKLFI
nr:MAG TPA: chitin synthase regulator [Caudoviricetes sp.]